MKEHAVAYRIVDWRKGMAALEAGSVDLVLADPPYGDITDNLWDHAPEWEILAGEIQRVLTPAGTAYIFGRQPSLIDVHLQMRRFFELQAEYVWDKGIALWTGGKHPTHAHEDIWWYRKHTTDMKDLLFNLDEVGRRQPVVLKKGRSLQSSGNQRNAFPRMYETRGVSAPPDVLRFGKVTGRSKEYRGHPTQKPIALVAWLIRAATKPGQLVLDPFAGSGTTLYAAALTGRRALGFERNRRWAKAMEGALAWRPVVAPQAAAVPSGAEEASSLPTMPPERLDAALAVLHGAASATRRRRKPHAPPEPSGKAPVAEK